MVACPYNHLLDIELCEGRGGGWYDYVSGRTVPSVVGMSTVCSFWLLNKSSKPPLWPIGFTVTITTSIVPELYAYLHVTVRRMPCSFAREMQLSN